MSLGSRINQVLRPFGIFVGRVPKRNPDCYFPQHPSCQIPNMGYLYEAIFGRSPVGYVVEVGAYDGIFLSNSSCLIEKGWHGLLIEPVAHLALACRERYASNSKVQVLQIAAGAAAGQANLFYMDTMSSMSEALKDEYKTKDWAQTSLQESRTMQVELDTLDSILTKAQVPPQFEVLIVDVEGMETAVFSGLALDNWKPKMLIVELADFHPDLKTNKDESFQLASEIIDKGYRVIYKDHINTIFVRDDLFSSRQ